MLFAPDAVEPADRLVVIEQEAPVRRLARRLFGPMVGLGQAQRGAVIDRRQAAPQQHLALEVQLLRALVAAIDPARRDQPLDFALVKGEAGRLALLAVRLQPQPGQVGADGGNIVLAAARGIGIVDPQQEVPAMLLRQQPVVQRRADIADMEQPRR